MSFFGPPNIEKLKANHDVNGLIQALEYKINNTSLKNINVNIAAAETLRELKDTRALEPFIKTLRRRDEIKSRDAAGVWQEKDKLLSTVIAALGEFDDPRAIPVLLDVLSDISTAGGNINSDNEIAKALAMFGEQAVEPLINQLKNLLPRLKDQSRFQQLPSSTIAMCQERICYALAMVGEPSVDSLISMYIEYSDSQHFTSYRRHVAKALLIICAGVKDTTIHTRVVKAIASKPIKNPMDTLDDTNHIIAQLLGEIGVQLNDPELNSQVIETLIKIAISGRGSTAQTVLVSLGSKAVEPLIAALYIYNATDTIASILADIGDERALGPIVEVISKPGTSYLVARNLKKFGWKPDKSKAGAAYWAYEGQLEKCIEIGSPAVEPLIQILEHYKDKSKESTTIIKALGKLGDERAVMPLIKLFLLENFIYIATRDPIVEQVIEALGEIGEPALETINAIIQDKRFRINTVILDPRDYTSIAMMKAKTGIEKHLERKIKGT